MPPRILKSTGIHFCRVVKLVVAEWQPRLERMRHLFTIAEETQDIERHARDPGLLHGVDHRF
jgi:hypothetical protein